MGDDTRIHPRDEGTMDQDRLEIRGRVRQVPALEIAAQAPAEAPPADPYWGRRYRSQFNSRAQGYGCDRRRMGPRGGGAQSIGEGFGCSGKSCALRPAAITTSSRLLSSCRSSWAIRAKQSALYED